MVKESMNIKRIRKMPKSTTFSNLKAGEFFMLCSDIDEADEAPFFMKIDDVSAVFMSGSAHILDVSDPTTENVIRVNMTLVAEY